MQATHHTVPTSSPALSAEVLCAGTHVISCDDGSIILHELVLHPVPHLLLLVKLPSPAAAKKRHVGEFTSATWADDGTAVLLSLFSEAPDPPMPWDDPPEYSSSDDEGDDIQVRMMMGSAVAPVDYSWSSSSSVVSSMPHGISSE